MSATEYETVLFDVAEHVATVTLNRPERLNAFNQKMCDEFAELWRIIRSDDDIHVVVLRAGGERAFCTGMDTKDGIYPSDNLWNFRSPGELLGPKGNHVWKPVVCALHGMVAGGAFFWVNEADIVICAEGTEFFDPHVSYGLVSAIEVAGLAQRIPLGEISRMMLLSLDERMSAERAYAIGLVSEVVAAEALWCRAAELAAKIAAKPTAAVQGSVKALWVATGGARPNGQDGGVPFIQLGNPIGRAQAADQSGQRPAWELR